jgi:hypothetical protein
MDIHPSYVRSTYEWVLVIPSTSVIQVETLRNSFSEPEPFQWYVGLQLLLWKLFMLGSSRVTSIFMIILWFLEHLVLKAVSWKPNLEEKHLGLVLWSEVKGNNDLIFSKKWDFVDTQCAMLKQFVKFLFSAAWIYYKELITERPYNCCKKTF